MGIKRQYLNTHQMGDEIWHFKNDFSFMYICLVNHCSLDAEWSIAAKEINIAVCLLRKWYKGTGGGLHILGGKPRQLETLSVLLFQPSWAHSYFILLFSLLIISQTYISIFWQSQHRHPDVLRLKQKSLQTNNWIEDWPAKRSPKSEMV